VQHYSDGTDVNWVQQVQGDAEAEHPAPNVVIARTAATASSGEPDASGDGRGIGLGIAGIVLALLAGGVALNRAGRSGALTRTGP
jgi:hypothetical protein